MIVWKTNFDQSDDDARLISRPHNLAQNGHVEPPSGDSRTHVPTTLTTQQSPPKRPWTAPSEPRNTSDPYFTEATVCYDVTDPGFLVVYLEFLFRVRVLKLVLRLSYTSFPPPTLLKVSFFSLMQILKNSIVWDELIYFHI